MTAPLTQEFPEKAKLIRSLQLKDRHFSRLFDEYHQLALEISQLNSSAEQDQHLEALRIRRLYLKDKLLGMLED